MGNGGQAARLIVAILAILAVWLSPGLAAADDACRDDTAYLRGDWGEARFTVELADDADERAQGLMYREAMAQSAGMLFVYDDPGRARFWMKNTLIPLDMLFADASGSVRRIARNAVPGSERLIDGGGGIQYVLEINGGLADALNIDIGTQLRHPAIPAGLAAWPC